MDYATVLKARDVALAREVMVRPEAFPYLIRKNSHELLRISALRRENARFAYEHRALLRLYCKGLKSAIGARYVRSRQARAPVVAQAGAEAAMQVANCRPYRREQHAWSLNVGRQLRGLLQVLYYPKIAHLHRYMECALSRTPDDRLKPVGFLHFLDGAAVAETLCWRMLCLEDPNHEAESLTETLIGSA